MLFPIFKIQHLNNLKKKIYIYILFKIYLLTNLSCWVIHLISSSKWIGCDLLPNNSNV